MANDERAAEIERLKAMLSASQRMGGGYASRIAAIQARLKELEA